MPVRCRVRVWGPCDAYRPDGGRLCAEGRHRGVGVATSPGLLHRTVANDGTSVYFWGKGEAVPLVGAFESRRASDETEAASVERRDLRGDRRWYRARREKRSGWHFPLGWQVAGGRPDIRRPAHADLGRWQTAAARYERQPARTADAAGTRARLSIDRDATIDGGSEK